MTGTRFRIQHPSKPKPSFQEHRHYQHPVSSILPSRDRLFKNAGTRFRIQHPSKPRPSFQEHRHFQHPASSIQYHSKPRPSFQEHRHYQHPVSSIQYHSHSNRRPKQHRHYQYPASLTAKTANPYSYIPTAARNNTAFKQNRDDQHRASSIQYHSLQRPPSQQHRHCYHQPFFSPLSRPKSSIIMLATFLIVHDLVILPPLCQAEQTSIFC